MMNKKIDELNLEDNTLSLISSYSIIISLFYYFNWSSRLLISYNYLLFNTLTLFVFTFLILFFLFKISKYFKKNLYFNQRLSKTIYLFLIVIILTKLIQIPFFYANIISAKDLIIYFLKNIIFLKSIFLISILKILILYLILTIIVFYFLKNKINETNKFIKIFSFVFLLVMSYDIYQKYDFKYEKNYLTKKSKSKKQIVWILFDGFDPNFAFKDKETKISLKNFDNLRKKSISSYNTFSPASNTLESLSSIFMSSNVSSTKVIENKFQITDNQNNSKYFIFKNTLFQKLIDQNYNFKVISEVLTYCAILKINKDCIKNHNSFTSYFDGIKYTYIPSGYIEKIKFRIKKKNRSRLSVEEIKSLDIDKYKDKDILLSEKLGLEFKQFEKILKSGHNLIFIHLFPPHTAVHSSKYIQDFLNIDPITDLHEYYMNLKFTDILLKNFMEIIEKHENKEMMLLLTSDHWARERSSDKAYPSLFTLKIKEDNSKYELYNSSMNIFIPDLIESYLNNKSNTHDSIEKFLKKQPIIDSNQVLIVK
jgi:hypothetical protein